MKKIKLVRDWRQCWKWFSVHCMAINTAVLTTWATLPEEFKQTFDAKCVAITAAVVTLLGVLGRLIEQQPPANNEGDEDGHYQ